MGDFSGVSQEKTLLAQMTGLIQVRRDSAAASDGIRGMLGRAESGLAIRWHGVMKTAANVVHEQQGDAATIAPAATREDEMRTTEAAAAPTNAATLGLARVPQASAEQPSLTSDGAAQLSPLPSGAEQPAGERWGDPEHTTKARRIKALKQVVRPARARKRRSARGQVGQ